MATHSSVLAWRIPGKGEPGGLTSMGSHRVRHDWSDLAAYLSERVTQFWKTHSLCVSQRSNSAQSAQAAVVKYQGLCGLRGSPGGASGKGPVCQGRRHNRLGFDPWVKKIPWRRAWQPTPVFLPGESHGQRSLTSYRPRVAKSRTRLKRLSRHTRTWLKKQKFIFSQSWRPEVPDQGLAGWISGEGSLPELLMAAFLPCLHKAEGEREPALWCLFFF